MIGHDILKQIVVRISQDGNRNSGTGFYISRNEIATCYHVLASEKENLQEYYFIKHDTWPEWIQATPFVEKCDATKDIAILNCPSELNRGIEIPPKIPLKKWDKEASEFLSQGYCRDTGIEVDATIVRGTIVGKIYKKSFPRLQLQTIMETLRQGRSGSPIWSKNAIVGMIDFKAGEDSILTEMSTAIPIEEIVSAIKVSRRHSAIPVVIIAMNKEEACKLKNGELIDAENGPKFKRFIDALKRYEISNWDTFYEDDREKWRPMICKDKCIDEIIINVLNKINRERSDSELPEIEWENMSNDFFDLKKQKDIYLELAKSGGIMVIDPISLFHPCIRDNVIKSQLFSASLREKLSILIVSPIDHSRLIPNCIIENLIDLTLPTIIDTIFGGLGDTGIGDARILQRALFVSLPKAEENIMRQQIMKNKDYFREYSAQKPSGICRHIFSGD
jgi:hypothetical protein